MSKETDTNSDLAATTQRLLHTDLPHCLDQLSQRHASFMNIANNLEQEYVSAQRSGVEGSTRSVMDEGKRYVAQALQQLTADISFTAKSIDQLLSLQEASTESLTSQLDLARSRIQTAKHQHLMTNLYEMQAPFQETRDETLSITTSDTPSVVDGEIILPPHLR